MWKHKNIAQQYALTIGYPETGFIFDVANPKEFHNCFYFDLIVKNISNNNDPIHFGGPAGIIVSKKDMQAHPISFGKLSLLEKNEAELEMLYNLLTGNSPINDQLSFLKKKFKMKSEQFLHLHDEIVGKEKKVVLNIIQDMLDKQKDNQHVN